MTRCLAACRDCGDDLDPCMAVPFTDPDERDRWIAKHIRGTGHDARGLDGWPSIEEAARRAFGVDQ